MAEQEAARQEVALEGGSYEIIRKRLEDRGGALLAALEALNADRREVFGAIESRLLATERITTASNCTPRDMVALGDTFLFAYNVQFGLKSTTELADVFSAHRLEGMQFVDASLDLLRDEQFLADFANLYKYYKNTVFARFWRSGPHLHMVFRIGKSVTDVKSFKWLVTPENTLRYIDNRSDHEYRYPPQHEFEWKRTNRDFYRDGRHPHISIEDRVFIECVGGDLTIKVEDNTQSGEGIYSEPVDDPEQKLDDAEIHYATIGPLILLRVRPYREQVARHFVFNEKIHQVDRVDEIAASCVLLPEGQGLVFPNGYYLLSGELKRFEHASADMLFDRRVQAPNGEDTLFVFHRRDDGLSILLSYNMIEQSVRVPVLCHGFSLFHEGQMLLFRAEQQPQRHHAVQAWQTPYVSPDFVPPAPPDSFLSKIGNRDLVRAMAECRNIAALTRREEVYQSLYDDLHRAAVGLLDSTFWLAAPEAHGIGEIVAQVRDAAAAAIDEFDKVRRIQKATADRTSAVRKAATALLASIKPDLMARTDEFVAALAKLRSTRGEIISLRELRYADLPAIEALEKQVVERSEVLAKSCVEFLLKPGSLAPWEEKVAAVAKETEALTKVVEARALEERIGEIGRELETMIEVVGNLRVDDPTKSTQIIDGCSSVLTSLNTARARLRNRRKDLQRGEAVAEFSAQVKLLEQSVSGQLDVADTPAKVDGALNKLLVQVEELEGRFADFEEYVAALVEKRAEITAAFDARRVQLQEERGRKAESLHAAATRMLKAIQARAEALKTVPEINAYFAGDLMIEKVRGVIAQLVALEESVRADEIESRLKSTRENAARQLKDRQELFLEGENTIRLGKHLFSVNTQKPELTILRRDGAMAAHITGTNYMEEVADEALLACRDAWEMEVVSEDATVSRAEHLAWILLESAGRGGLPTLEQMRLATPDELLEPVRAFMSPRYDEGYTKGVHDLDASRLLRALAEIRQGAGLLRHSGPARALARVWWTRAADARERERLAAVLSGAGRVLAAFPEAEGFEDVRRDLATSIAAFCNTTGLYAENLAAEAAEHLFLQVAQGGPFVVSAEAAHLHSELLRVVREAHALDDLEKSLAQVESDLVSRVRLVRGWISGFLRGAPAGVEPRAAEEAAALLACGGFEQAHVRAASTRIDVEGLSSQHARIESGRLAVDYPELAPRLRAFIERRQPLFRQFQESKKAVAARLREELRLGDFEPRVLTSFVRNRLVDEVYLPLVGDNLAKQIGAAGARKRTDLMGMLLLVSPPGYGKTTLMEYVASRLGLVFAKINGPAIGHAVTSLDPGDAPNAAAAQEVQKLNLALEMGDNVMIYVDDIQHCHPEFLQKFISLCDGQRRIEGVWRGRSRTYDLRGRKVCVVMAGNPYTESGEKFKIPDMLANRADTYNLGDIIGDNRAAFEESFIENALTSNAVLSPLHARSRQDVKSVLRLARGEDPAGIELESPLTSDELADATAVLRHLVTIQSILLRVNKEYILSAGQADEFRTEPPFKLQGSYRNMNKLAEKVVPLMNDDELRTLILSHYENEAQTLTTGAEANLLRFLELAGWINDAQAVRLDEIRKTFRRNQRLRGADSGDHMANAIVQLTDLNEAMSSISAGIAGMGTAIGQGLAAGSAQAAPTAIEVRLPEQPAPPPAQIHLPEIAIPEIKMPDINLPEIRLPERLAADLSDETIARLASALSEMRLRLVAPRIEDSMEPLGEDEERPRGEFLSVGAMREALEHNGYTVDEVARGIFRIHRDGGRTLVLRVRNDRLDVRMDFPAPPEVLERPGFAARLLELNAAVQPVSFAINADDQGGRRLVLLESRDGKHLTRAELMEVLRTIDEAAARAAELLR